MKNLLIILTVIASGILYGWTIVTYPLTGQFIAGFIGAFGLFLIALVFIIAVLGLLNQFMTGVGYWILGCCVFRLTKYSFNVS